MSEKPISLEERLRLIKTSRTSSPKASAMKLVSIANMKVEEIANTADELKALDEFICEKDILSGGKKLQYEDICRYFDHMLNEAIIAKDMHEERIFTASPTGIGFINAMVTLAQLFLLHAKQKREKSNLHSYLRMRLNDFWDAVVGTCVNEDGSVDKNRFQVMTKVRDDFMSTRDGNLSLKEAIAELLNDYLICFKVFGSLNNIWSCDYGLNQHLKWEESLYDTLPSDDEEINLSDDTEINTSEDEETYFSYEDKSNALVIEKKNSICQEENAYEEKSQEAISNDESCDDIWEYIPDEYEMMRSYDDMYRDYAPEEYFWGKAKEYQPEPADFSDEAINSISKSVLLDRVCYSKAALENMGQSLVFEMFRNFFYETINSDELNWAKTVIDSKVIDIYRLLVLPYIDIGKYKFDESKK